MCICVISPRCDYNSSTRAAERRFFFSFLERIYAKIDVLNSTKVKRQLFFLSRRYSFPREPPRDSYDVSTFGVTNIHAARVVLRPNVVYLIGGSIRRTST